MSTAQTLGLGALAGLKIFIGIPKERLPRVPPRLKDFLHAMATGSGLHNSSDGLAIGQSAAENLKSLALVLVIGFALHNATEGFGIIGPLTGEKTPPSWRFLGLVGLISGAPTFIGTLIGHSWTSENLSVAFFTLAAGSILYVVVVDEAPEGIDPLPIEAVVDELPPALVDLALWVADYYGSTPGRALELIAPLKRKRRKEQAPPGERQSLALDEPVRELTEPQH